MAKFYIELPVFDVVDEEHEDLLASLGAQFENKCSSSMYAEINELFDGICNSMGIPKLMIVEFE